MVAEEKYVEGDEEQGMEMNRSRKESMEGLQQLDISVMGTCIYVSSSASSDWIRLTWQKSG